MNLGRFVGSLFVCIISLTSCGDGGGSNGSAPGTAQSELKAEAFCDVEGLEKPLRQTFIVLDGTVLNRSSNALEFAQRNEWIRDVALEIGDPSRALSSGATGARERVSIIVIPSDGQGGIRTFTGCLPGLSQEEIEAVNAEQSSASRFLVGSESDNVLEDQKTFRTRFVGGLQAAASRASEQSGAYSGPISKYPFMQGLNMSRGLFSSEELVPRFFLITDTARIKLPDYPDGTSNREKGIASGFEAAGNLGLAEIHIRIPPKSKPKARDFFEGYFLAQAGKLQSYSSQGGTVGAKAPKRIWKFRGQATLPTDGAELIELRLGDAGDGKLSNAWIKIIGGVRDEAIPVTGTLICDSDGLCKAKSDDGGFAQVWTSEPGGDPEFSADIPFGGMRDWQMEFSQDELSGAISDPGVRFPNDANNNTIPFKAAPIN